MGETRLLQSKIGGKTMKKIIGFIAVALTIVACNKEIDIQNVENVNKAEGVSITATLAPKSDITKAVADLGDDKITVTWAVDEHLAILYTKDGNRMADARITAVDGTTGAATIEFSVEAGTADDTPCIIVYPLAAAKEDHSAEKSYDEFLSTQDGTLNANLDVRVGSGKIQVTKPELNVTTQPNPLYAIIKFTLGVGAKELTVTDGLSNVQITHVTAASATNSFYVALPPAQKDMPYIIRASNGTSVYVKNLTVTKEDGIESGKYYQTSITSYDTTYPTTVALADLDENYVVKDLQVLSGILANNVKISIADGATVTLAGVSINADGMMKSGDYAGITCLGDATINLADGTMNTVKGIGEGWPGIYVPGDYNSTTYKTLTIQGTGTLNASGRDDAPGIGGAKENDGGNIVILGGVINASGNVEGTGIGAGDSAYCGDITISGGTVTATAGPDGGAGIGTSGTFSRCRNILINGGTVIATGGDGGIGIGSGFSYTRCGRITIAATITSVTAIKGKDTSVSEPCIGKEYFSSQCGNIFFGSDSVYNGTSWTVDSSSGMPVTGRTYGGLNFTESTTNGCVTWTLTPTAI